MYINKEFKVHNICIEFRKDKIAVLSVLKFRNLLRYRLSCEAVRFLARKSVRHLISGLYIRQSLALPTPKRTSSLKMFGDQILSLTFLSH